MHVLIVLSWYMHETTDYSGSLFNDIKGLLWQNIYKKLIF